MTSFRADLRHGWRYAFARRRKLAVYAVTAAGFLVTGGYVHGQALTDLDIVITLAGAFGVHQVPNVAPRRPSPHPHD